MESEPSEKLPVWLMAGLEASLGLVALGLGWLLGVATVSRIDWNVAAIATSIPAMLPPLGLLVLAIYLPWRPAQSLLNLARRLARELLGGHGLIGLALVSIAAGFGEELLFRGAIQTWLVGKMGVWPAIALASLLFGLAHPLSRAYFVVATLIGLYLGWLYHSLGNLLVPCLVHAGYDLVALVVLLRPTRQQRNEGPNQ